MALKLEQESQMGVSFEYHRIFKFELRGDNLLIFLRCYVDKAARDAGKLPIKDEMFSFPKTDFNFANGLHAQAYAKLKEVKLSGAQNC